MCGLFLVSCAKKPVSLAVPSQDEPGQAEIVDANGLLIAQLNERELKDTLWLTLPNQEPIVFGECGDRIMQAAVCPEGSPAAVVYERNCGASTDWATRIDLVSSAEDMGKDDRNTIFIIKGSQQVTAAWKDSGSLMITFPQIDAKDIYKQQDRSGEITVEYVQTDDPADETRYLEYANFNFGLTGIAAGVPEEILLRMAGWAQKKSGMTRSEWGEWDGDPPYGDDPHEHMLIKEGFLFYYQNRDKILNYEKN